MLSYASGISDVPLLGETIGENLDRTVARFGDREALVDVAAGTRWTYARVRRRREPAGPRAARPRHRQGRPGRHLGAELRRVGARPVRHREDRRDPGQRQPGVPDARARVRRRAVRDVAAGQRGVLQDQRLPGRWSPRSASRDVGLPRLAGVGRAGRSPTATRPALRERAATLAFDDPINIQYTSGTTGFPKGATLSHHNILNNGYFVGELVDYTEHDRICIPVPLYHCFGMVMGNLAATSHGACMVIPAQGFDPAASLRAVAAEQLHLAVRRADHVHRRARPGRLRRLRPVQPAHRDHGGLAVPGRGDEAGGRRDAHDRGGDLLRHDGDLAGVHDDPGRRHPGPAHRDGRPGAAAPGVEGRRPGDRPGGRRAASRGSCAPAATR